MLMETVFKFMLNDVKSKDHFIVRRKQPYILS